MAMEEVGTLGYIFACVFGVGAELVCDAIVQHGTDEQKKRYVKPLLDGACAVFNTMMIPERLGTAAMTIGAARPALEIATGYSGRRKAFGATINSFQGVSFQVAEAAMPLDASRAMV